jgi:hypothetical protein
MTALEHATTESRHRELTSISPSPPATVTGVRLTLRAHGLLVAVVICSAIATVSLLTPATLGYDAWSWLVWGRELRHFTLDTTGGPSWKPLPAIIAAPLSFAGDATPVLWLLVARVAGLMVVLGVFRLARRAGGWIAGVAAVALLLPTPDGEARFVRLLLEGHTAPAEAALAVWSIERAVNGRHRAALSLVLLLALLRPEAWPFLLLYGAWAWRHEASTRRLVGAAAVLVPVMWFGADWWGSGNAWHGAAIAQVVDGDNSSRFGAALTRAGELVVVPVWALAAVAVATAIRRREHELALVAAAAVIWSMVVVGMCALFGYAALSRFLLPTVALVCVLAGVGMARALAAIRRNSRRALAALAIVALTIGFAWGRLSSFDTVESVRERARLEDDAERAVEQAGGRTAVLACGPIAIDRAGLPNAVVTALAWKLHVPLARVRSSLTGLPGVVVARTNSFQDLTLAMSEPPSVRMLARSSYWAVYTLGCDG